MAVLIEGLQGSGKSYYATYKMHYDQAKYTKIFTNIDGIKETEKIKLLPFKEFMNTTLKEVYEVQVEQDLSFDDCIEIFKDKGVLSEDVSRDNRTLLVVDEAQNYFGKSVKLQPQLVWFITQHRHLFIELYLITQKYTLLRDEYKLFNVSYKAYPPVKQFNPRQIKYEEFAGLSYPPTNKVKNFTLKKEQKIFDMYISGDKVESPSVLKRFALMFIALVVFLFLIIFYYVSSFGGQVDNNATQKTESVLQSVNPLSQINSPSPQLDQAITKKFYTFVVWREDAIFYIDGVNNEKEYPIKLLTYIKDEYFIEVIDKESDNWRTLIYVLCNDEIRNFLGDSSNEKKSSLSQFSLG